MTVRIEDSLGAIRKKINDAAKRHIDGTLKKSIPAIQTGVGNILEEAIKESPEYNSLVFGRLRSQLGVSDADVRMSTVLDTWKQNIQVTTTKTGFSVKAIRANYQDVINLPDANVLTQSKSIPWLEWLLMEGSETIIVGYSVKYGGYPTSRTDSAIMVPGGSWGISGQFAGTKGNNFVTRSLATVDKKIRNLIITEIKKNV